MSLFPKKTALFQLWPHLPYYPLWKRVNFWFELFFLIKLVFFDLRNGCFVREISFLTFLGFKLTFWHFNLSSWKQGSDWGVLEGCCEIVCWSFECLSEVVPPVQSYLLPSSHGVWPPYGHSLWRRATRGGILSRTSFRHPLWTPRIWELLRRNDRNNRGGRLSFPLLWPFLDRNDLIPFQSGYLNRR